jgi:hypothetical protein
MANSVLRSETTQNVAASGLGVAGTTAATLALIRQLWPTVLPWSIEGDAAIVAFASTVLQPLASRWLAFFRNASKRYRKRAKAAKPIWWLFPFALVPVLALQGCVGMTPALAGKTKYSVTFSDATAEQTTNYQMQIRAPAGVDLAGLTGMSYDWDAAGAGRIAVNSEQTVNTETQAATLAEVNAQQAQMLQTLVNALAPVIGQVLQHNVRRAEIDATRRQTNAVVSLVDPNN